MATESLPGTLPHESPAFGLVESHATMKDAAGMFDQLATLFDEIGGSARTPRIGNLAALGAYYAREHVLAMKEPPKSLVDCAALMDGASDTFGQLETLFDAIHDQAAERQKAKTLAGIGRYSACDFANTLDVARERAEAAAEDAA